MHTLRPLCTAHCCSVTSYACKRARCCSYSFSFSLPLVSGPPFLASVIGSSHRIRPQPFPRNWTQCLALPGENEAGISRRFTDEVVGDGADRQAQAPKPRNSRTASARPSIIRRPPPATCPI